MQRLFRSLFLSLLIALIAVPATAGTWKIDPAHSILSFKVRHLFSRTGGSFGDWAGTLEFDGENPASLKAEMSAQTASIDTGNKARDKHLRSADFFSVEEFPTLTFVSTSSVEGEDGWELHGDLTMRGVTLPVAIPFEFLGAGTDPWGNTRGGFSGKLTIQRKDFGISYNQALDKGGMMLGDDVVIELEIEAVEEGAGQ